MLLVSIKLIQNTQINRFKLVINNFMSELNKSIKKVQKTQLRGYVKKKRRTSQDYDYDAEAEAWETIEETYQELNNYILNLDEKIDKRLQITKNNLAIAYKNHLQKVTKQLKKLKELYDFNQQKFSSDKTINHLTKQCILFRQQAIRLHTQLEDALEEMDVYRRKSQILEKQVKKANETAKKNMLKIKLLEAQKMKMKSKIEEQQSMLQSFNLDMLEIHSNNTNQKGDSSQKQNQNAIKIIENNTKEVSMTPQKTHKSKLYTTRPLTTETTSAKVDKTKIKNELNLKLNYENLLKQGSIFSNQKLLAFNETLRQKPREVMSGRKQQRMKTTNSRNSYTYRNLYDETNLPLEGESVILAKNKNQLNIFYGFLQRIQSLRSTIIEGKSGVIPFPIHSKDSVEFLMSDSDVISLLKTIFRNLEIEMIENSKGIQFKARQKQNKKSLAQLSSALMQKFKMKRTDTENRLKTEPNIKTSNFQSKKNLENLNNKVDRQKACKFQRMEQAFSKKAFTKNHRMSKFNQTGPPM